MGVWDGITDQKQIIDYFSNIIRKKQISHAYILEGDPSAPKKQIAEAFSRVLLCERGTGCGQCHSCRAIDSGNHPDLIYVQHEKADVVKIDEIRDQLVEDIQIRPYSSSYKIYIVEDADRMNTAAQNALLKTLEEPPSYGVILLLAVNADLFLPTILSRSIRLKCRTSGTGTEQMPEEDRQAVLSVVRNAWNADRTEMADAAADWKKRNLRITDIGSLIRLWLRDILILKSTGNARLLTLSSERSGMDQAAERYSFDQIQHILNVLDLTEERILSNVNFELACELLLTSMRKRPVNTEIADEGWEHIAIPDEEELRFYESLQEDDRW